MSIQSFLKQQTNKETESVEVTKSAIRNFQLNRSENIIKQNRTIENTNPIFNEFVGELVGLDVGQIYTEAIPKPVKKKIKTGWDWLTKQLMKPVGMVAAEVEQLGLLIGTGKLYVPGRAGLDVLMGKEENSFTEMWTGYGANLGINPRVASAIGFVSDVIIDPLNFIGAGLTTKGRLATKVTSLLAQGDKIVDGSKLAKQIIKLGLSADDLVLGATKAEQVLRGQRAFVTFAGKPLVKGLKIIKKLEKAEDVAKATKMGQAFTKAFITKTGIPAMDKMIDNFQNLSSYRKTKVIETALDIQKTTKNMSPAEIKIITEALENPVARETIQHPKVIEVVDQLEDLYKQMKYKEKSLNILKSEIQEYVPHIKIEDNYIERIKQFFKPKVYKDTLGASKGRKIPGTVMEINQMMGKEFFQANPVVAYTQRGLASSQAISAKEFLEEVGKKFFIKSELAPIRFMESTNPLFRGLRAEPEVVRVLDQYIQGIQPEELRTMVKAFDSVQNWWKAQVLISPSYHLRNMAGNFWNNWLAGIKSPVSYYKAGSIQAGKNMDEVLMVTDAGKSYTKTQLLEEMQKRRVIGKGWYAADIKKALTSEIGDISKWEQLMPWEQENILFKSNRQIGGVVENNARMAHFIELVQSGYGLDEAALNVKKYLFDYEDLTKFERTILKRIFPFYTWTRKNIPLQIEHLITNTEKFAAIPKVIKQIESGIIEPKTEKYLSSYISENIPVRIRQNEEGNTEYFLLGNWLPSAQAIDFLSNPFDNIVSMATPFVKVPIELWANKSMFFKNTLGEPSKIEYYYKQPTEFINIVMRRKTAHLMRNIRILNDLNKLIKTPTKDEPENSWVVKLLNVLFGKAATYDISKSRYFYRRETEDRISELKAAIKKAKKLGDMVQAKRLIKELKEFQKER